MPSNNKKGAKLAISPSNSTHTSPTTYYSTLPNQKHNAGGSSNSNPKNSTRPRTKASNQRKSADVSDDSELTSVDSEVEAEDSNENEEGGAEDYDDLVTPRKGTFTSAQKSGEKRMAVPHKKGKAVDGKKKSHPDQTASSSKTTTGPAGRDKKRAIKVEDAERRRARDAKFDVDEDYNPVIQPLKQDSIQHRHSPIPDDTSSYGDDESERDNLTEEDHFETGIPTTFHGQEIEDLAYGGGDMDAEMAFWDDNPDEEEEEMFINHLSGSEVDRQSQSSISLDDSDVSTDDSDESSDEVVDEFGFPVASAAHFPIEAAEGEDPGLILMENWDGQFVLVQPRAERSRSRHRGDRGSRTADSVNGSIASGTEQPLIIDMDAHEHEFSSEDSYWSGMSDEDDDGGDTTDSMAEEDMPMLDSPALNEMMDNQMAEAVLRMAVEADISGMILPEPIPAPSVIVTDIGDATPALSTASSTNPLASAATLPTTPSTVDPSVTPSASSVIAPAPSIPMMGTFLPMTGDPAQCAVIDGSGSTTKSPFTHRRRSRRNRDVASLASSKEDKERKRRSSQDPFSPARSPSLSSRAQLQSKKLRYSSIPGHPRYVAARRAAEALVEEGENTESEEEAFNLEDMLEEDVLVDNHPEDQDGEAPHLRHMLRFDRVGVSTYLRRNFGPSTAQLEVGGFQSPGNNGRLDDTLLGPIGGRMLVSPVLNPVDDGRAGRRERRKKRREVGMGAVVPDLKI